MTSTTNLSAERRASTPLEGTGRRTRGGTQTPWEAALGAGVSLPTLDGSVRLKVPAGSSSGRKIRLKGKGYPTASGERGDLFAELRVEVPTSLTPEERELLERWATLSKFNPREEQR